VTNHIKKFKKYNKMRNTNNSDNKSMSLTVGNTYYIDAGIGKIAYSTHNLQLQAIMEAIEEKLRTKSPNEITAAINAL